MTNEAGLEFDNAEKTPDTEDMIEAAKLAGIRIHSKAQIDGYVEDVNAIRRFAAWVFVHCSGKIEGPK